MICRRFTDIGYAGPVSTPYQFNRPTRRCDAVGRPLRPGEAYVSAIFPDGEGWIRRDYAADAWDGPPEGCVAHWRRRMPAAGPRRRVPAPPEVLVDLLRQMERFPERTPARYVLALDLLRRKIVQSTGGAGDLNVVPAGGGEPIAIVAVNLTTDDAGRIAAELDELMMVEEGEEDLADDGSRGGDAVHDSGSDP